MCVSVCLMCIRESERRSARGERRKEREEEDERREEGSACLSRRQRITRRKNGFRRSSRSASLANVDAPFVLSLSISLASLLLLTSTLLYHCCLRYGTPAAAAAVLSVSHSLDRATAAAAPDSHLSLLSPHHPFRFRSLTLGRCSCLSLAPLLQVWVCCASLLRRLASLLLLPLLPD